MSTILYGAVHNAETNWLRMCSDQCHLIFLHYVMIAFLTSYHLCF